MAVWGKLPVTACGLYPCGPHDKAKPWTLYHLRHAGEDAGTCHTRLTQGPRAP